MSDTSSPNKRIAKNSIMLYIRMLLAMVVGLYTSRVVLATLGIEDFGIYGVVGSFIAMMAFLNASMSSATSRFITFELGKGNVEQLSKTFSNALIVHILIALIVLILAETVGLWILCNKLVIPEERMFAAHCVYQLSVLGAMVGITQTPYNATIIAHEHMDVYAHVELLNVVLKLLIVYLLAIGDFDKLILYGILSFCVSVIIAFIYRIYCITHFHECKFHWIWDNKYIRPLLSFSGWNIYYEASFAIRQQGANFLLNMFCGLVYNAASGIAATVQGVILGFSSNLIMAFRPQVIKSYAQKDYFNMNRLIRLGTKFGGILLMAITIPLLFKVDYILKCWLTEVPEGASFMVQCLLIVNIVNTMSMLLVTGIQASGKIASYSSICGSIYLVSVFFMYGLLRWELGYTSVYYVIVVTSFIVNGIYAYLFKIQIREFEVTKYYRGSVLPLILVATLSSLILWLLTPIFHNSFLYLIIYVAIAISIIALFSFIIAFNSSEKRFIINLIKSKIKR